MKDPDCIRLLRWALPRLGMRWPGFRKVRGGVCKRIGRRMRALGLPDADAYRAHLESHPGEWETLDGLCRVSISRFFRDKRVFENLTERVLPEIAARAVASGEREIRCWSAGCASGEEPYTLSLAWRLALRPRFPGLRFRVLGADSDPRLLERAAAGLYPFSSVRDLPADWRERAFERRGEDFRLRDAHREGVRFLRQDVRAESPGGDFHLSLARNLVFTYFAPDLQRAVLERFVEKLRPGGFLVLGSHETLPEGGEGLAPWPGDMSIHRKAEAPAPAYEG